MQLKSACAIPHSQQSNAVDRQDTSAIHVDCHANHRFVVGNKRDRGGQGVVAGRCGQVPAVDFSTGNGSNQLFSISGQSQVLNFAVGSGKRGLRGTGRQNSATNDLVGPSTEDRVAVG